MNVSKLGLTIAAGLVLFAATHATAADELVVSSMAKSGKNIVSLDVLTEGNAVAVQFNIELPKGVDASQVDLTKCMADLPKTHTGQCNVAKGQIIGIAYNDDGVTLPAGLVSIGQVSIDSKVSSRAQKLKVVNFVAASIEGKELPTASTVSEN